MSEVSVAAASRPFAVPHHGRICASLVGLPQTLAAINVAVVLPEAERPTRCTPPERSPYTSSNGPVNDAAKNSAGRSLPTASAATLSCHCLSVPVTW